ncbi:MAG: hypothetical protein ACK5PD_02115 [Pirellulaceae bacterium]|jgi:hypothetical protein
MKQRAARGAILLDVILAIGVFACGYAAISTSMNASYRMARRVQFQEAATQRAVRMLELLESPIGSEANPASGTFEEDPSWNWEVQDQPGPMLSLRSRTIRIWKRFPDGLQSLELKRLIGSAPAEPTSRKNRVQRSGASQSIEPFPGVSVR